MWRECPVFKNECECWDALIFMVASKLLLP